jgi:hypothetical protein
MRVNLTLQFHVNSTERWKENQACICQTSFWSRITLDGTLALDLIILLVSERHSIVHSTFIVIVIHVIDCLKCIRGVDAIDCLKRIRGVDAIECFKCIRGVDAIDCLKCIKGVGSR